MLFEKRIIKKAQDGDTGALESLFKEHFKSLFVFVMHKVDTKEDAEDITSEAFRKAFEKISTFKFKSSFTHLPLKCWA